MSEIEQPSARLGRIVTLEREPGLCLTSFGEGRRAELEVLDDGALFLTLYAKRGEITVLGSEEDGLKPSEASRRIEAWINRGER